MVTRIKVKLTRPPGGINKVASTLGDAFELIPTSKLPTREKEEEAHWYYLVCILDSELASWREAR